MVISRPINLNVSCKLHPYSLQRTRSPPGPRLPKRIRNTHPRNYYDLKGKDIDENIKLIDFNDMSTPLWLLYALKFGNRVHAHVHIDSVVL